MTQIRLYDLDCLPIGGTVTLTIMNRRISACNKRRNLPIFAQIVPCIIKQSEVWYVHITRNYEGKSSLTDATAAADGF